MIAVTGSSGKLGRLVVEGLLARAPSETVVALARTPSKVADLAARGAQVREADYTRPETLGPALQGVERLLLVSASDLGHRLAQHRAVIEAARDAQVKLLAYTSILRADESGISLAEEHRGTEALLRQSGLPFVLLRNGWYLENYTENLATPLAMGALLGCADDGQVAGASRTDLADAAVAVLTEAGHAGETYELAGDDAFTLTGLAEAVAAWSGRPFTYRDLPPDAYREALLGAGVPAPMAAFLVDADEAIARGDLDSRSGDLHRLLGRDTRTLDQVLARTPIP